MTTPPILTQERTREVHRDQPVFGVYVAPMSFMMVAVACHHRSAPRREPLRPIASCLAPGFVRSIYMIVLSLLAMIIAR